jgi:RecQ family ATP-dependent DNA helicase
LASSFLDELVAAVRSAGEIDRPALTRIDALRGYRPAQIEALVQQAIALGLLVDDSDGRLHQAIHPGPSPEAPLAGEAALRGRGRPLRVVAIDFESVVRTTAARPYLERRAFQIGALRFGRDREWVRARRSFSRFCVLPDPGDSPEWQITSPAVRAAHAAAAVDTGVWLAELDDILEGADAMVAYNGLELDFPLLDGERRRAGLAPLGGIELIDGLLLAYSIWPNPPNQHRLARLAERLEIDLTAYTWHEALSDCRLLAAVLLEGARTLSRRIDPELADLLLTVCDDSPGWNLLADLAGLAPSGRIFDGDDVAAILGERLDAAAVPRRRQLEPPPPTPVVVPNSVVGDDGRVDPHLLAEAIRGELARRPAQGQMAELLSRWIEAGHGGMVEAPTGTGKSLVLLAAALEWVRAEPERRAVIATHTKQLQGQLAADIERLAGPGGLHVLEDTSDLVKGAVNRLSLRALTLAIADSTDPALRRGGTSDPAERELLTYLALRLVTATTISQRWLAHSVDVVDVPMIFGTTTRRMLSAILHSLSQSDAGEFRPDADLPASLHTDRVHEALAASRIVVANHALLMAHRESLAGLGPGLAVFVDEAHELEAAATEALSSVFDYQALERIPGEIDRFAAAAGVHPLIERAQDAAGQLRRFLASEVLPGAALRTLDLLVEPGTALGRRTATLASPYSGRRGAAPVDGMRHGLARAGRYLTFVAAMLARWAAAPEGLAQADRWATERFGAAASTVLAQREAIDVIAADLDLLLGPLVRRVVRIGASGTDPVPPPPDPVAEKALVEALDLDPDETGRVAAPNAPTHDLGEVTEPASAVSGTAGEQGALFATEAERIEGDDESAVEFTEDIGDDASTDDAAGAADDASVPDDTLETAGVDDARAAPVPNAVVWAAEAESPDIGRSRRRLRFSVTTSPIALGAEPEWREFLHDTPRLVLTSGTLRVEGSFDFMRMRLGLGEDFPGVALESPFAYASQARLVVLGDFPSWAEHPARAVRTVAHQVCGWARLVVRPHEAGGWGGGTMVLTTSRASAAAISEASAPALAEAGIPLATTETLGNARAVEQFVSRGGVVVGTRGLWQGVDVADPERLRLVWINKLPFAPFADPVIAARRAHAVEAARLEGEADPERVGDEAYYLPLAALGLRQAVGRLIRSTEHRGVIVIGDAKLAGFDARRRMYRRVFLGSLDPGLRIDGLAGDIGAGNVMSMRDAWHTIIAFGAEQGFVDPANAETALSEDAIDALIDLPETAALRAQILTHEVETELRAKDPEGFGEEVVARAEAVARILGGPDVVLRDEQRTAIAAVAEGRDLLALLPTGFGKSYCYQLPGLVLPGVTVVVSPLVSLMVDQAMGLGSTIGPMVRALTGPMRESNSRLGKSQVAEMLRGEVDHGIRIVYLSPERLADARFRALVAEGVARGIVRRIAVDEAHTLVDWGDDFRPAFRRLDRWLTRLRADYPDLGVSALTATANATVREGIRSRLFALPPAPEGDEELVTVEATPLRPELAIWHRRLSPGSIGAIGGVIEAVTDALEGHAIYYCLTVREVERVYSSLRDYLGDDQADRILRYHGRLSQAERAVVATAFRTAPRRVDGEEFRPMIVVATSAFGLGIDRDDIRTVFCVSPPTDLAALYQQLGRAGRDSTQRVPGRDEIPLNAAMAMVTQRSWRTAAWMAAQDLNVNTLRGLGDRLLERAPVGSCAVVDLDDVVAIQIDADIAAHRLPERARRFGRVLDEYRAGAMRALAALGACGAIEDLGDIPDRVRIAPGELACDDSLWQTILRRAVADPEATTSGLELARLYEAAAGVEGYAEACPTIADLWTGLAAAHDWGWVDVSQQTTRARLAVYEVRAPTRPAGFEAEVTAKAARAAAELARLRAWFEDSRCAHLGFAEAFGAVGLPEGTCATSTVRCSGHWNAPETWREDSGEEPALHLAFFTPRPQPSAATAEGRANFQRRLQHHIADLLWQERRGLSAQMLRRVLHGEDSWYSPERHRWRRLWPSLLYHKLRGSMVGVRMQAVEEALGHLAADRQVVELEGGRWRWAAYERADAERARRAAGDTEVPAAAAPDENGTTGRAGLEEGRAEEPAEVRM